MDQPDRNHRATDKRPKYNEAAGLRPDEKIAGLPAGGSPNHASLGSLALVA